MENDAYMLQLSYYIHNNPLRAGMVKRLVDYRWSSYPAYAYGKNHPPWLNTERILSQLVNAADRNQTYREKMRQYAKEEDRAFEDLKHGLIFGTESGLGTASEERFSPGVPHREIPPAAAGGAVGVFGEGPVARSPTAGLRPRRIQKSRQGFCEHGQ